MWYTLTIYKVHICYTLYDFVLHNAHTHARSLAVRVLLSNLSRRWSMDKDSLGKLVGLCGRWIVVGHIYPYRIVYIICVYIRMTTNRGGESELRTVV